MSRNIYFKNWKNKNKPTNIVLVYHTKIYFNVAMWVFVSLWLQCEAVWKAGWARRTTDTEEERRRERAREVNKQYLGKKYNQTSLEVRSIRLSRHLKHHKSRFILIFVCFTFQLPMKSATVLPRCGRSERTQLKSLLNTNTWTKQYWGQYFAVCFNLGWSSRLLTTLKLRLIKRFSPLPSAPSKRF